MTVAKLALDKTGALCTMCAMKDNRLNIRIDDKTKEILEEEARKNDSSMAYIVRFLVRNFIHLVFPKKEAKQ